MSDFANLTACLQSNMFRKISVNALYLTEKVEEVGEMLWYGYGCEQTNNYCFYSVFLFGLSGTLTKYLLK